MGLYDLIILGFGISGASTAYHIKEQNPDDRILIIDKMSGPGQGNTAKSAAMCRNFFSSDTNFKLADSSINFYRHLQEKRGVYLRMEKIGYLFLLGNEGYREIADILEAMGNRGLEYELFDSDKLKEALQLETCVSVDDEARMLCLVDVEKGLFIPYGFSIDPSYLVDYYTRSLKEEEALYNAKVDKIILERNDPNPGVQINDKIIKAKKIVIAAGSWTSYLLEKFEIYPHFKPKSRYIFTVQAQTKELKELIHAKGFVNGMPFTILPRSKGLLDQPIFYIKPNHKEETFWIGYNPDFLEPFKPMDEPEVDENIYEYVVSQDLRKYFPQFRVKISSCFAGQYQISIDGQPVIFEKNNLIIVGGPSGSGIMKADAIGRIAAAVYAGEDYATLYSGKEFKVSDLSLKKRRVEPEMLVI